MGGLWFLLLLVCGCADEPPRPEVSPVAARYLVQAQTAFQQANFSAALALIDSADVHADPEHSDFRADLRFLEARVRSELNQTDEARMAYERVLELKPNYQGVSLNQGNAAFRLGQYSEALVHYRREQIRYPDPRLQVYIGRSHAELGHIDSARAAYEQAIAEQEDLAEAHIRLSQLYDRNGEAEKALPYAKRALELDPENAGYRYMVGLLELRTGQPEQALEHLTEVVAQRPLDHEVRYNLGQALVRLGRSDQARIHLAAADSLRLIDTELNEWQTRTRLEAHNPAVWATYGYLLRRLNREAEAMRAFNTALYLDPANPEVRFEIANLHLKHGELSDALAQYEGVLQQDSTIVGAWVNAGIALARIGQREAARKAWEAALRHEPGHPEAEAYLSGLPR